MKNVKQAVKNSEEAEKLTRENTINNNSGNKAKKEKGKENILVTAVALFGGYIFNTAQIAVKGTAAGLARFFKWLWNVSFNARKKLAGFIKKAGKIIFGPFIDLARYIKSVNKQAKKEREENGGRSSFKTSVSAAGKVMFGKRGIGVFLFNFALPVISVFFLFSVISYAASLNYAVKLYVNDDFLGYIENEQVFFDAQEILNDRISLFGDDVKIEAEPSYSIEQVGNIDTLTKYEIADLILGKSGVTLDYGYGFFINDVFYGALMDFTNVKATLDNMIAERKTDNDTEKINFVDSIRYDEAGLYLADSFIDEKWLINLLTGTKEQSTYYSVELNDSPFAISEKLGMTMEELDALNPGFSESEMHIGDKVKINNEVPFLSISSTRTEVYNIDNVPFDKETYNDDTIYEGQSRVAQQGEYGENQITANVTYVDGVEINRDITKVVTLKDPVTEITAIGVKKSPAGTINPIPTAYGKISWPLQLGAGEISQWTEWEGGYSGHKGIDIAAPYGTPIYSGAAGVVTKVAYLRYGLGYHIYIYHEDLGITTIYAHCSAIYVTEGQRVAQGECIGLVGKTGLAYGNHVHLGVLINGVAVNPHAYLDIPPGTRINLV